MQQNPLFCIICGFERGGTTLIAELIRQHPRIDGRFECGFLLVEKMADYATMDMLVRNLKAGWGLSQESFEYIIQSPSHEVAYRRLVECSNIPDKNSLIYDKTPQYMVHLTRILNKVEVPCVCVVRDPRALYWSNQKRWQKDDFNLGRLAKIYQGIGRIPIPGLMRRWTKAFFRQRHLINTLRMFSANYLNYALGWQAANQFFSDRILLIRYEALCTNPKGETRKIFDFLGLEYQDEYLAFPTTPDPYVNRGGILTNLVDEYKGGLSSKTQDFLLYETREFSEWHWLKS
jgi:hypothetical protein